MSDSKQNLPHNTAQNINTQSGEPASPSRRRLTGAGLGVSAIFTLASRPVLATNCVTASAAASGNLSHHGTPPVCSGKKASVWASTAVTAYPSGNPKFNSVFMNGTKATWGTSDKLSIVLNAADNSNTGTKPNPISKEFAATLLNIRGGFIPASVLSEAKLINMWVDWVADGSFAPQAGASWGAAQIVTYLQGLQS